MNRQELIESAQSLKKPSKQAVKCYQEKINANVGIMNSKLNSVDEIFQLIGGERNIPMMENNNYNHAQFMYSIFENYIPEVFVDTIIWVFATYRSHGFSPDFWSVMLPKWIDTLKGELNKESFLEIKPFYQWIFDNHSSFTALTD